VTRGPQPRSTTETMTGPPAPASQANASQASTPETSGSQETRARSAAALISVCLGGATGVGLIFNLVLYGSLLCLSLYLQQARHESVLATGLLLLPMSVITGLGSLLGRGPALSLRVPLLVAAVGFLIAIALAWVTISGRPGPR
jgi:hypothetical protein